MNKPVLYELLYCSSASQDLTPDDIANILNISRKYNSEREITGCLLYYEKQFIQIIEGDKQLIKGLFANIEKDIRHKNVILLGENEKEKRFFNHWSMAFKGLSLSDMENIDEVLKVNNFVTYNAFDYKMTKAMKLFCKLAKDPFKRLTESYQEI